MNIREAAAVAVVLLVIVAIFLAGAALDCTIDAQNLGLC